MTGLFLGLDLAWTASNRTGLAIVDDSGRLLDSGSTFSDDGIAAWIEAQPGQTVVAAVDAPLIVPNATGQRVGENLIARRFGAYGASPHSSNTSIPLFDPPRARTLAERFTWTVDPANLGSVERPACIEVYPHPAMVSLFGLGSVLPYKAGRGRTPVARRGTFLELLGHLERVSELALGDHPRWLELRQAAEGATRQMHLEAIEDEIDAILCAHLAWLWHHSPESLQVYGSLAEGYIVAPPPPAQPPQQWVPKVATLTEIGAPTTGIVLEVWGQPGTAATARGISWRAAVVAACEDEHVFRPGARLCMQVDFVVPVRVTSLDEWDLDNLLKPTIDGLATVLGTRPGNFQAAQANDERIDRIVASKRRAVPGEELGARIVFSELVPD